MADITAACLAGTVPRLAITAGTAAHRKAHFKTALPTMASSRFHSFRQLRPNSPARMALPQAITGTTCTNAGPMPSRKASREENRPMQIPARGPVWAANTNSTQLTRLPVISWDTDNGPTTTAPAGNSFPASWASTTSATPSAVSQRNRIAL